MSAVRGAAESPVADAEARRARAAETLRRHGQEHVLAAWDKLDDAQRVRLLDQAEAADFALVDRLYRDLVVRKQPPIALPAGPWTPAEPTAGARETAREEGLRVLRDPAPLYGVLVVAGGSGSGLKFPHPKGLFPATPLSGTPLFEAIVRKTQAAARANGQGRMYPMVVMLSDETAAETEAYFAAHGFFGERDRIRFARQTVLPLLDRRPGREGRVAMAGAGEIAMGGAGHGDAFDHVLAGGETAAWLKGLGVRYLHFMNVDNLLNPVGDPVFLGEHVLSERPAVPGRAHISVVLVPKAGTARIGNVIAHQSRGRTLHESVDYGLFPEVDRLCETGHVSVQIVTLDSLAGSEPIPFTASQKEVRAGGAWIPVWKFERSSNNKKRYGALLLRESAEVFAPIKRPSAEAAVETPAAAAKLQSDHWKRLIQRGAQALGETWSLPDSTMVELPWAADFMTPDALGSALRKAGFPRAAAPRRGYLVLPDFAGVKEIPLPDAERPSRRREDRHADARRVRALIAAFNNHFEAEPDVIVRAPGRNTLIGDHMDYPPLPQDGSAHSHTIAWASRKNVLVAARRRPDRAVKILSVDHRHAFSISLDDLDGLAEEAAHGGLPDIYGQELHPWALSVLALFHSARHGRAGVRTGLPVEGAEFAVQGNVPMGGGQSSSAAFLVAMTLACNDLFHWGVPRSDVLTLADIARSGEHEDYSPFIRAGRCGYLDQVAILTAAQGQAVLIDHGDYRRVTPVDLAFLNDAGYTNAVVLSGLSRSLGETDYAARVEELSRLPAALNRVLQRRDPAFAPKRHVHQFTPAEWRAAARELEAADPTLARRAAYVFEEKERTERLLGALAARDIQGVLEAVNGSGEAMSMTGPYQISGLNKGPRSAAPFPALDALRRIVLERAGPSAAARMIGGGGAGPLCLLVKTAAFQDPAFGPDVARAWREATGLDARVEVDPPSAGAQILWRREASQVIRRAGPRRLEQYTDPFGETVYRLVDEEAGAAAEVLAFRGTVRAMTCRMDGADKAVLFNPEADPEENGAAPYLGPWINRIKDGRARFDGLEVDLKGVEGVRDDGDGHALHGLMTAGWRVDQEASGVGPDGVRLTSVIETTDYTDHPGVLDLFGPSRTVLVHRLAGTTLHIDCQIAHTGAPGPGARRIPALAAVHPWFLLDPKKHPYAELSLPARRHRLLWRKAWPRMKMIPVPLVPALPLTPLSPASFRGGRRIGTRFYDDTYTGLEAATGAAHPIVELRDWFRDMRVEVGVVRGFDEFTVYRAPAKGHFICLEPQVGPINALGRGAPPDAAVPTLGPGETFAASMFIRVSALSKSGTRSAYAAAAPAAPRATERFPRLVTSGFAAGPLAEPGMTVTHKDAIRVFFRGRWHIYGTGHEMRDPANPPPGHRPHRRSIMFHLSADRVEGPYREEHPPVLLGDMPKGVYEAPGVAVEGSTMHLFAQTTYYRLGGTIEHFTSEDGHNFHWAGTAIKPLPGTDQAGVYDADAFTWGASKALVYSGFSREGGRDDRPDPRVFLAVNRDGWGGLFRNGAAPILSDKDVPWHNPHDPANPLYEWGLEGAQLLPLPDGRFLLLCVGFERRPGRAYMAAQRLFFALYDRSMRLKEVSAPILPLAPGWDEYGHGSMMIDPEDRDRLRMLFQARPANHDRRFRDSDSWRLFEASFDIGGML